MNSNEAVRKLKCKYLIKVAPLVSHHPKSEDFVVAYGRWWSWWIRLGGSLREGNQEEG